MIGRVVRTIREKKGWTLSELARRAEISKGMLSQVERGKTNPSVDSLRAIASALEVPTFSLFLQEDATSESLVRKDEHLTLAVPGSSALRQVLTPNLQGNTTVLLCTIPPGARSSPSPVHHEGEEWLYVLKGSVLVHLQGDVRDLDTGDFLYFNSRLPHYFENEGETEAEFICSISPSSLHV